MLLAPVVPESIHRQQGCCIPIVDLFAGISPDIVPQPGRILQWRGGSHALTTDYKRRMLISLNGDTSMRLFTSGGLLLAVGYKRIEFGNRGPYVEIGQEQIQRANIHKAKESHYYYDEFRSNCEANVKVYLQRKRVDYADYRIGMYYVSPFDLRDKNGMTVIDPLENKPARKPLFDLNEVE
jgi:hypothetical protein